MWLMKTFSCHRLRKGVEFGSLFQNPLAGKIFMLNHEATGSGESISEISSLKSAL